MVLSWRRFQERAAAVLHLDEEPSRLASGMAVGVFIGITPLYGLHTLLALAAAYLFRLNKAVTITGAWMNLPWFAPFVYGFCFKLGEAVLEGNLSGFSWSGLGSLAEAAGHYLRASPREHVDTFWHLLWDMLFSASRPLLIGTTLVGAVVALVTYFVTLEAVRDVRRLRHPRPAPARAGGRPPRGEAAP